MERRRMLNASAAAFAAFSAVLGTASAQLAPTPSPVGAKVYFIEPRDGAEISGPVVIKMGLAGMGVAPAGVEKKDTGHHHILVDQPTFDAKAPLPADDRHRHFGNGQTETSLALPPGRHTLQLVLGDHNHIPHSPPVVSGMITITVK